MSENLSSTRGKLCRISLIKSLGVGQDFLLDVMDDSPGILPGTSCIILDPKGAVSVFIRGRVLELHRCLILGAAVLKSSCSQVILVMTWCHFPSSVLLRASPLFPWVFPIAGEAQMPWDLLSFHVLIG